MSMPPRVHEFSWPDRVVIGTLGLPGQRTFYLQVRAGKQLLSIALEKVQSAQLAEKIDQILGELMSVQGNPFSVPSGTPIELVDNEPLESVNEQFRAGAMTLGWDPSTAQVVVEAYALTEEETETPLTDGEGSDQLLRVRMPVGAARAFAKRTREVVGAGRPMCQICGYPVDADGHTCTFPEV